MKRFLCLLLVIVTALSVVSCSVSLTVITRGKIDGNVYTNDVLGITFTKPTAWVYSTDEEIASLINTTADILNEDLNEALEKNGSLYDMMATDPSTNTNIIIGYEKTNVSVERYIDALKEQTEQVSSMSIVFPSTYDEVTLGQKTFTKVVCQTQAYGVSMKQVYYLCKLDGYMSFIILTIPRGYTIDKIEQMFN